MGGLCLLRGKFGVFLLFEPAGNAVVLAVDCGERRVKTQLLQRQRVCKIRCEIIQVRFERHEYESEEKATKLQVAKVGRRWYQGCAGGDVQVSDVHPYDSFRLGGCPKCAKP